jgi:predicted exporter/SAM-dependent methyltransferase
MARRTSHTFNSVPLIVAMIATAVLLFSAVYRIRIDTDITSSLPKNDPVIADAIEVFSNHPIHDQIAMDVGIENGGPELLVACGEWVEGRLRESHLFRDVGMKEVGTRVPELMLHIVENLPILFTAKELQEKVLPLLEPGEIQRKLEEVHASLLDLEGVGQAEFIARDPLGLKNGVLGKLGQLMPSQGAHFYKGQLMSSDQRHLLVTAIPETSGTDTTFARQATELIGRLSEEVNLRFAGPGQKITLTPVGAYRAALDNELIIRRDVTIAISLATAGIALLLILAFPRPLVGFLSLLPAVAGTVMAFFVYSLLHKSISIMVLGFGGAIISITVDHSIAYLLFLDRPNKAPGRQASKEAWAVGQLAVLTTIGAFAALCLSGFPILEQLGQFTALGVFFSFAFVHLVFPLVFRATPKQGARRVGLQKVVNKLAMSGKRGAWLALAFFVVMLFFAKPEFNVNLSSMNTVSKDTAAADRVFSKVWGTMESKVFVMTEAKSVKGLQDRGDRLLDEMDADLLSGVITSAFVPSMLFPGAERRKENLSAWVQFWSQDRVAQVKKTLGRVSSELGFSPDAFEPFYETLTRVPDGPGEMGIPEKYFDLLGISRKPDGSMWVQFSGLTVDKGYNAEGLFEKYRHLGKVCDPAFFTKRLGSLLFATFQKMLIIVASGVALLVFLVFLDLRLTLVSLVPVLFAFVSTLGTLKLMGHPLDLPGLMLSVVVLGMGIDYSLFFVRSYQRYGYAAHPAFGVVRMTVFMAAASTIIGFGVLCSAQHMLLRSAGLTSLLGIAYSLIGAFVILPPVLEGLLRHQETGLTDAKGHHHRVLRRYRNMEPYPRLFARFKLRLDPMFSELADLLGSCPRLRTILDVGSGYGVPAAWCLELCQEARVYGIEPDAERARVASMALGSRGVIEEGQAPEIPALSDAADLALLLDIMHYLDDDELAGTLGKLLERLDQDGRLVIRASIQPQGRPSWSWRFQNMKLALSGTRVHYRSVEKIRSMITQAGFKIDAAFPSRFNEELYWLVAKPEPGNNVSIRPEGGMG